MLQVTVSVIIPVLNEVNHIGQLIQSINGIDSTPKEIFIVDGGSSDGTQEKVLSLLTSNLNLKLIDNPEKYVSQGFNKTFKEVSGEYLALVGAHATYPKNYFSECIKVIEKGMCDVSGGFLVHKGQSPKGCAIALAMSSKFGVGDTDFRTNPNATYVDSVAFAVYHKKVFETVGLFDEALIRNQDDEFHYRLNAAGFRIMMLPQLKIVYFVRESFKKLFIQYYNYGLYKPLVFKKVRSGMRARHLIPSLFVIYLISLPFAFFSIVWLLPLLFYGIFTIYFGWKGINSWKAKLWTPAVFPVLHISYGLGFLNGLYKWKNYKS